MERKARQFITANTTRIPLQKQLIPFQGASAPAHNIFTKVKAPRALHFRTLSPEKGFPSSLLSSPPIEPIRNKVYDSEIYCPRTLRGHVTQRLFHARAKQNKVQFMPFFGAPRGETKRRDHVGGKLRVSECVAPTLKLDAFVYKIYI